MRRTLTLLFGWLLLIVGVILFPLPVPLGAPMIFAGFVVLARTSTTVRRLIGRLRQRFPETSSWVKTWARRRRIGSFEALEAETDPDRIFPAGRNKSGCTDGSP